MSNSEEQRKATSTNPEKVKRLKKDILRFVTANGNVSYAELSKHIDGFRGNYEYWANAKYSNLLLWRGMSEEAIRAIWELVVVEKVLTPTPASFLVYLHIHLFYI